MCNGFLYKRQNLAKSVMFCKGVRKAPRFAMHKCWTLGNHKFGACWPPIDVGLWCHSEADFGWYDWKTSPLDPTDPAWPSQSQVPLTPCPIRPVDLTFTTLLRMVGSDVTASWKKESIIHVLNTSSKENNITAACGKIWLIWVMAVSRPAKVKAKIEMKRKRKAKTHTTKEMPDEN